MADPAFDVIVSGPLFDGLADNAVDDWLEATRKVVAKDGEFLLRSFPMNKTGRATGAFQASVRSFPSGTNEERLPGAQIRGRVWTPWLEGVSKRNEASRFKGYHLFRLTAMRMRAKIRKEAQDLLVEFIRRMGGEVG